MPGPHRKQVSITNGCEKEYGTDECGRSCGKESTYEQFGPPRAISPPVRKRAARMPKDGYRKGAERKRLSASDEHSSERIVAFGFYYLPAVHTQMPYHDAQWTTSSPNLDQNRPRLTLVAVGVAFATHRISAASSESM